jgi:gp45 sliding clamp, C terminal
MMKLSSETLNVLKNFSTINPGIAFNAGSVLRTISAGKTVLAKATLKEEFPEDFCINDLSQFLSVYSLYKDTVDIDFDDVNIILTAGKIKTKYRKTAKEMIITTDKDITLEDPDVTFRIPEDTFSGALKSANVLQSPNIAFESDGDKIYITSFDAKDDSAHINSIELADGNGKSFKAVFMTENMKMIPGTYDVEIHSKGLAAFKNAFQDIDYWIALEAKDSNFGE